MTSDRSPSALGVVRHFRTEWRRIGKVTLVAALGAQCEAAALVLIVPLAASVAGESGPLSESLGPLDLDRSAATLTVVVVGCLVGAMLFNLLGAWMRARITVAYELEHRNRLMDAFAHADHETQVGDRVARLDSVFDFVGTVAGGLAALGAGAKAVLNLLVFVVIAFFLDYRGALLIAGAGIGLTAVLRPVVLRAKGYTARIAEIGIEYRQELLEAGRMMRELVVFSAAEAYLERMKEIGVRFGRVKTRGGFLSSLTTPLYQYLGMMLIVVVLAIAQVVEVVDVAAMAAISLLLLRSFSYGQQVQGAYQTLVQTAPYIRIVEELSARYAAHRRDAGALVLETVQRLELSGVSYSYDGRHDALASVSLTLHRGEIVGIVGPSGSGKSTLSQILLRLRRPTAGTLLANGVPAEDHTLASWYRHVSLVPQEPRLLHGTVAENIRMFDPRVGRDEIVAAARAAGIDDVIDALSDGYDTLVGPSFRDLSGGQVQRIGIARALARNAGVIVLDEPTSALDVHSEARIQETLEGLRGRALVVIIAHRLSTLSICDRIVVLDGGRLETTGSLMAVYEASPFFRAAVEAGTLDLGTGAPQPST